MKSNKIHSVARYFLLWSALATSQIAAIEESYNMKPLFGSVTMTNRSFRIELEGRPVFLRIGRENPAELEIDRRRELENYKVGEELGIVPALLAYDLDNGILVTEFIEGESPSADAVRTPLLIGKMVAMIRNLHEATSDDSRQPELTVFLKNDRLQAKLAALNTDFGNQDQINQWMKVRDTFEDGYYEGSNKGVCHGDYWRGNFLESQEGKLYLIDWEYSYFGYILDDLGNLCSANWLDDEDIKAVIRCYWGEDRPQVLQKLKQNVFVHQMDLYVWCHIQAHSMPDNAVLYLDLAERARKHLDELADELLRLD